MGRENPGSCFGKEDGADVLPEAHPSKNHEESGTHSSVNHQNYTAAVTGAYTMNGSTAANPILTYSSSFGGLTAANNSVFLGPRQLQFGARVTS